MKNYFPDKSLKFHLEQNFPDGDVDLSPRNQCDMQFEVAIYGKKLIKIH